MSAEFAIGWIGWTQLLLFKQATNDYECGLFVENGNSQKV